MKAYNKQQESEMSLKAQFCRQHFSELLQFLRDFDISKNSDSRGQHHNSLNMNFLLQAYKYIEKQDRENDDDFKNKIERLEQTCHWKISNVEEPDVLLAIEDYFSITSKQNDLTKLRNILLKNLTTPGYHIPYKFEDNTTKSILKTFGIHILDGKKSKMGNQRLEFTKFIIASTGEYIGSPNDKIIGKDLIKKREELCFDNAFKLLCCLRNWNYHKFEEFDTDEILRYYRFIIYTHIGIAYVCRRLWKRYANELRSIKEVTYDEPTNLYESCLPNETIKVVVKANKKEQSIEDCKYFVGQIEDENDESYIPVAGTAENCIEFEIEAKKYEPFRVIFKCDGKDYKVSNMLNYYLWSPTLNITVEPPEKFSYTLTGIAGTEKEIEDHVSGLFTKYLQHFQGKGTAEEKKIITILENMEPMLCQLREFCLKELSPEEEKKKQNLKDGLLTLMNQFNEKLDGITREIYEIKENQKNSEKKANQYFQNIDRIITNTNKIVAAQQESAYKKDRTYYLFKHIPSAIILLISIGCLYSSYNNDYSLMWLQNRGLFLVSFLGMILLSAGGLWIAYNTTIQPSLLTTKKKSIGISLLVLTTIFLLGSWALIPYKDIPSLVKNYDFGREKKEGDNYKAAKLIEDYLIVNKPVNDEEYRIQLARYYLDYANLKDMALEVTKPMRENVTKYPKGAIFAAEALYATGRDYRRVHEIIKRYRASSDNVPAAIDRLEGIMYCYDNQYYDRDLNKGISLLRRAADEHNDPKAQYFLGHIYSHVLTSKNETALQDTLFNLITAIKYLQKAYKAEPKAALELGRIYTDINMTDSARFYLSNAIVSSTDSLNLEANYRMGLLLESIGQPNNEYMNRVIDLNYKPALLHAAINEQNHAGAIEYYEAMGRYKGHRYIPPVVFEYMAKNEFAKALDTLKATRAKGGFNEEFIEGMKAMLTDKDSLKGLDLMRKSASSGCKYAKMICLFRDMEKELKEGQFDTSKIEALKDLSTDIKFADYLISNLLQQKARTLEALDKNNSIITNDESEVMCKEAEKYALKILSRQHPVGVLALIDGRLLGYHFDKNFRKHSWPLAEVKKELSHQFLLLRMAPDKQFCIMTGEHLDRLVCSRTMNLKEWNNSVNYHFWSNAAIANKYLSYICSQLINIDDVSVEDVKKLTEAAFELINDSDKTELKNCLASRIDGLRKNRHKDFSDFILQMEKKYKDDSFKYGILSSNNYKLFKDGDEMHIGYSFVFRIYNVDNQSILDEFSNIEHHYYDKPL